MKPSLRRSIAAHSSIAALLVLAPVAALAQTMPLYSGSDSVRPVAEAALVSFVRGHANYKPQLRDTGTSPGLKDLCNGVALVAGASRPINGEESKTCAKAGIQVTEIPVALDAIVLAVSNKNTWLKDLTLAEITKIFDPASAGKITSWKQIRATFPDLPLKPAGADIKHGTFQFFT